MEKVTGSTVYNPVYVVTIFGGGRQTTSINGSGISLNGNNQYIDVEGGSNVFCGGSFEDCSQGFTLRFKVSSMGTVL